MKPTLIKNVLDLAKVARSKGEIVNPLFTGEAGLGKSQICQQWVKEQRKENPDFGFLDLRIAYMEAPDLIGFPETDIDKNGLKRTAHRLPEFWPTEGEGLILLEEPNRGTTGVMNCLMQLLTDRIVHNYHLPEGWIIAGCVNPEGAEYDVNRMDAALSDRFEHFEIDYDPVVFLDFIEMSAWEDTIQMFISSGSWTYKKSEDVPEGSPYISPRTWSKLQASEVAGVKDDLQLHRIIATTVLGKHLGNEYWKFCHSEAPVTVRDLLSKKKEAIKRLKKQCDKNNYKGDMIGITVEDVIKHYGGLKPESGKIGEDTMAEVANIIPSDHALNMIKGCGFTSSGGQMRTFFKDFGKRHPELLKTMSSNIRLQRTVAKED